MADDFMKEHFKVIPVTMPPPKKKATHGAAYSIKSTRTQDATTHHQRTHVTDLYANEDEDRQSWIEDKRREHEDWYRGDR